MFVSVGSTSRNAALRGAQEVLEVRNHLGREISPSSNVREIPLTPYKCEGSEVDATDPWQRAK